MLELHDIETGYGAGQVLFGVSLAVTAGSCVSLMGRNGMGKTTTLKSILGIVPPRSGHVYFDGQDISNLPTWKRMRRDIAYVPEGRGMFHNLTVKEHLQMAARPDSNGNTGWNFDRVMDTFPRLQERLSNLGTELSGGEQQMLAIGRALVTNPRLMILDEATEGLAPLIRQPLYVPESMGALDLLAEMRAKRTHLAIVLDEYSGTEGLLTFEDLVEEIVGEIDDELDVAAAETDHAADGSFIVEGKATIRDLNREHEWRLPDEEAATLAGLVLHEARRIPDVGQSFIFHGFRFDILERQRHQITRVRITPPLGDMNDE